MNQHLQHGKITTMKRRKYLETINFKNENDIEFETMNLTAYPSLADDKEGISVSALSNDIFSWFIALRKLSINNLYPIPRIYCLYLKYKQVVCLFYLLAINLRRLINEMLN